MNKPLNLLLVLSATLVLASCKPSQVRTEYVTVLTPTNCPTQKADAIVPPASVDQGKVNEAHRKLALSYNRLAERHDGLVDCVRAFDDLAAKSQAKPELEKQ